MKVSGAFAGTCGESDEGGREGERDNGSVLIKSGPGGVGCRGQGVATAKPQGKSHNFRHLMAPITCSKDGCLQGPGVVPVGAVLNLRTISSQKCAAVPRRARI